MTALAPIEPRKFWTALGGRAVGAAVVAARDNNGPAGFLALSATHLCADPPTMLVSIGKSTSALATIEKAGHFAINYLTDEHRPLADDFSGATALKGTERFARDQWDMLETGAPTLRGAIGVIDCVLQELIERHGTMIALGTVVAYDMRTEGEPLLHFRGKYR